MGTDIRVVLELRQYGNWVKNTTPMFPTHYDQESIQLGWVKAVREMPFMRRQYNVFSFLAGVRNDDGIIPISLPKGFPVDFIQPLNPEPDMKGQLLFHGRHDISWLSRQELLDFNYDQPIYNYRGHTGMYHVLDTPMTWRIYLGEIYFEHLQILAKLNCDWRVVFGFDS